MRHETLKHLKSLIDKYLVIMTNQAYANNRKFGYRLSWTKGTGTIDDGDGHVTTNYYWLRFYVVDKTNSPSGKEVSLLNNYYAVKGVMSVEKLEEQAYDEFLLNGVRCMFNITYAQYLDSVAKAEVEGDATAKKVEIDTTIEQLRQAAKEEKPKLFVGHDFRPDNSKDNKPDIIRT